MVLERTLLRLAGDALVHALEGRTVHRAGSALQRDLDEVLRRTGEQVPERADHDLHDSTVDAVVELSLLDEHPNAAVRPVYLVGRVSAVERVNGDAP